MLDFGERVVLLEGPHVLDFEAGIVRKDVGHHSTSVNLMFHDLGATHDECLVQQVVVQPPRSTCQTHVPTG